MFAVGFLMRPLGGVLFGYIGDRYGRSIALYLSIGVMAVGTLFMGMLPTYATAGMLAPILMIACRIIQGLAVGGEYACSIVVLVETAPTHRRGFRGSWASFGAVAGNLLGSAVGAILFYTLTEEQIAAWGWRLPFLSGVIVALAGVYLRRNLALPHDGPAMSGFRFVNVPAAGYVSDRIGRKPLLFVSMGMLIILAWPLFGLLHSIDKFDLFLAQCSFTVILGVYFGVGPALLVEQFSASVRCTGVAGTYNLIVGLFGGTAPIACVYLIEKTGNDMIPALYLIAAAVIALLTALTIRETAFGKLKR